MIQRLVLTVLAVYAAVFVPRAGAQTPGALEVEEVVVSGTRSERSEISIPASIDVITREEIEESGAVHVSDVLRGRGGVQVSGFFGDGSRASVGMRGFGETANANTLVLVDGRRLNNSDIAPPDLNSIPLNDVERIEIVQGSAGVLFGDQAVGGVINIITRRPDKRRAEIEFSGGSYSRRGISGSLSEKRAGGLYYRISGEERASDNYRDHNAIEVRSLFAVAGYEYASGDVFAELQHIDERLQTPGALFADEVAADRRQVASEFVNDFANTETNVQRIGIRQALTGWLSLEAEATNREAEAEFVLSFRGAPASPANTNEQSRHLTAFTPRLIAAYPTSRGELLVTLGHDLELFDYHLSSTIGEQRNEQRIRGSYLQAVIPLHRRLSLTLGARDARVENDLIDDFSFPSGIDIDDSEFLTEAGLSFEPAAGWRLFARRDESVRFPKVDEFLDPVPGTILKTQTGVSYEFGAEWARGGHRARAIVYRLDLEDEITALPGVGAFGLPANTNLPPTRRDGVILSGAYRATTALGVSADYSYIDARIEEGPLAGNRVPFVARHNLRLGASYALDDHWRVYGELQAVSDRVFSGDFDRALADTLPGYTVLNLKSDYRYQNWTFEVRVNNVLDKEYSDFGARATIFPPPTFAPVTLPSFFPAPERNFWLSMKLEFD